MASVVHHEVVRIRSPSKTGMLEPPEGGEKTHSTSALHLIPKVSRLEALARVFCVGGVLGLEPRLLCLKPMSFY